MENIDWTKFATKDAGYSFNRTNPIPADKSSVYSSLTDAQNYAATSAVAYDGQPISVVTGEGANMKVDMYLVKNKTLVPVSGDGAAGDPWYEYDED